MRSTGCRGWARPRLAVHAAHLLRDRFPDRQLFIDLHAHTPGQEPVAPGGRAGRAADRRRGGRPVPAGGPGGAGGAVAGPDGRAAGAAGPGQRRQQRPGRPAAARRRDCLVLVTSRRHLGDLPGAVVPSCWRSCRRTRRRRCSCGWRPAPPPARPGVAELVRLAGYLPLAISLLARVYARHPSWTLADLAAETRASLLTLAAENRQRRRRVRGVLPAPDPAPAAVLPPPGPAPGHHDSTLRRRRPGRHRPRRRPAGYLDALHGEGLLTEAGYRRYGMHDLIRRYAQDRAAADPAADREQALDRLLDYYQHTAAIAEARLARQTRTAPAPGRPRHRPRGPRPGGQRAGAGVGTGRTRQPARLPRPRHPRPASMPGWSPSPPPWPRCCGTTAPGPTPSPATPPPSQAARQPRRPARPGQRPHRPGDRAAADRGLSGRGRGPGEALAIYRDLGDRLGQANTLNDLGAVRRMTGDYPGAAEALDRGAGHLPRPRRPARPGQRPQHLGAVRRLTGDYPGAAGSPGGGARHLPRPRRPAGPGQRPQTTWGSCGS